MENSGYLGIDVGSISTNLVVIDLSDNVLVNIYIRGIGDPIGSVQRGLKKISKELSNNFNIKGVCTTGSGRVLVASAVGADVIKNEIMAHARAALHLYPDTQTIFEIGGQDSKITIIRNRVVVDFAMNLVCAAGTGSFLDSQAKRLGIKIEEMGERSLLATNPTDIAGRCTVFAESDMVHKQQMGYNQNDIIMGLCHALVRNYLNNVCRGKEIKPPIVLQGGISANLGIKRAFEETLETNIIIPQYNMVMGAYGAALIVAKSNIKKTNFRGFGISDHIITTNTLNCDDCSNRCEIIEIIDQSTVMGKSGGRCGKWEELPNVVY